MPYRQFPGPLQNQAKAQRLAVRLAMREAAINQRAMQETVTSQRITEGDLARLEAMRDAFSTRG